MRYVTPEGELVIMHKEGLIETYNVKGMIVPVRCTHCGNTYDLTAVKINHRFMDCDQYTTPCCGYEFADTREWKSFKDFERINLTEKE